MMKRSSESLRGTPRKRTTSRRTAFDLYQSFTNLAANAVANARLLSPLSGQRDEIRAMASRLADVEESERKQLARELHDRVGQNLTALSINLNILGSRSTGHRNRRTPG